MTTQHILVLNLRLPADNSDRLALQPIHRSLTFLQREGQPLANFVRAIAHQEDFVQAEIESITICPANMASNLNRADQRLVAQLNISEEVEGLVNVQTNQVFVKLPGVTLADFLNHVAERIEALPSHASVSLVVGPPSQSQFLTPASTVVGRSGFFDVPPTHPESQSFSNQLASFMDSRNRYDSE